MGTPLDVCLRGATRSWLPPPDLLISQWAETYGVLTAESSSEPGRWHAIPYQIAMMDACCHPKIERVTIKKSARIGYTKIIGHVIGYHIHQDPCSILVVQPTIDDAEGWSKEELTPAIEQTNVLRDLVATAKSRDSGNTILRKSYPGGMLHIVGANSARGFRRITVRLVLFDETDGYPPSAGTEGDQEKLGEKRSDTAWNRKIIKGSTPTEEGISRIGRSWNESSQGHYLVPCPECGEHHIRRFRRPSTAIVIRGRELPVALLDHETAKWVCPACQASIGHDRHRSIIEAGFWFGEDWEWHRETGFAFLPGFSGHIGMHIWAGYSYSPNATPEKIIAEYKACKNDKDQLKTFVNIVEGEEWTEPGEQLDHKILMSRAEIFSAEVPDEVTALTCGADVQGDRIELEIVGWAHGFESWSIDYQVIIGEPTQDDLWAELRDLWENERWTKADGSQLRLSAMCIDSGFLPKQVYKFVALCKSYHVYPVKGRAGAYPIIEQRTVRARRKAKRLKGGAAPEMIGVDEGKMILHRRLQVAAPGPGYCHFPDGRDEEWYRQITGERRITRYLRGGYAAHEWIKVHTAVEALDCRNYAYAALLLADINLTAQAKAKAATTEAKAPPPTANRPRAMPPQGRLIR